MEGEDVFFAEIQILEIGMDGTQGIPVACNLSFIMVEGSTAAVHDGSEALIAGDDAFDGIGAFDRLDTSDLLQLGENLPVGTAPQT